MTLRTLLVSALVAAAALAGCTSDGGGNATPPAPRDDDTQQPTAPPPARLPIDYGPGGNEKPPASDAPRPKPTVAPVADAGEVRGSFESAWTLALPEPGARTMLVLFNLTGIEEGAPVTARVQLTLTGPDGTVLRDEALGLAGAANAVEWALDADELTAAGDYVLKASQPQAQGSDAAAGIPSAGLAKYDLYAHAEY